MIRVNEEQTLETLPSLDFAGLINKNASYIK